MNESSLGKNTTSLEDELIEAIWGCRKNDIKLLIKKGANLNYIDKYGKNLIDHAVKHYKNNDFIIFLLGQIKTSVLNCNGLTLFRYLREFYYHLDEIKTAHLFIDKGFNCNSKDENGNSLFHYNLGLGFYKKLLKHGVEIDQVGYEGRTPLHKFMREGTFETISFFLENGANPNSLDQDGNNCLIIFLNRVKSLFRTVPLEQRLKHTNNVKQKSFDVYIKILDLLFQYDVSMGVKPDKIARLINECYCTEFAVLFFEKGYSPEKIIRLAFKLNDLFLLEYLLHRGYLQSKTRIIKLFKMAINLKNPKTLDLCFPLITIQKIVIPELNTYIENAISDNDIKLVEVFIKHSVIPKTRKFTEPIHFLSIQSNNEITFEKIFSIDSTTDYVNKDHETLLFLAIKQQSVSLVESLLKKGFDPDAENGEGKVPLFYAIKLKNINIVTLLLEFGANPNKKGRDNIPPLYFAIMSKNIKIVTLLLQFGANPNKKDGDNSTSLYHAAMSGKIELVTLLLEFGADSNITNAENLTTLHYACRLANKELIELLIRYKGDINYQYKHKPIIEEAFKLNNKEIINLLLKHGANPNTKLVNTYKENSILIQAILNGWLSIASFLLSLGANPELTNKDGENALHAAYKINAVDMVKTLIETNANLFVKNNDGVEPDKVNRLYR
jgi:ankyrin repeat protein